ncbi:hypothetical protein QAD02_010867 [Eretmocerus hayati]|uniref:Uncharacterized protein n=1 Tax=Eretmocerus hayati TaxID=131215 RepID=A0ACC2NVA5_9HYME|nr:hypothetical protein QAD02_010867 [Eretmocerus hayati]
MADQEFADLQSLLQQWGFSVAAKYFEEESLSSFMNLSISQFIDSIPHTYERLSEFKDVYIRYCIKKRKLDRTAIDVNILSEVNSNTALSPSIHPGNTFQTGNSALSICSLECTSNNKENRTGSVDLDSDIVMTSLQNVNIPTKNTYHGLSTQISTSQDSSDNVRDVELASRQSYSSLELNDPIKELQAQLGSVQVHNTTKIINNDSGKIATKRSANRKPISKAVLVKDKIGSLKTLESLYDDYEKNLLYFKYLNGDPIGKIVLLHYKSTGIVLRQYLSNVIMEQECLDRLMDSRDLDFTPRDYDNIATDILKLVPLDEIHRHQYHSKGSSVKDKDGVRSKNASRGTLPTAVNAMKTGPLLRADFWTRVLPPCENMPDIPKDTLNNDQNETFKDKKELTWAGLQDLYEAWKRNRVARFTRIYKKFTISEIVVRFEIIKNQEFGPLLVGQDFKAVVPAPVDSCQFPGPTAEKFIKHFPEFAPSIVAVAQECASKQRDYMVDRKPLKNFFDMNSIYLHSPPADCSIEYMNTAALLNLAPLLCNWTPKGNNYGTWVPNTLEKAMTFIDHSEVEVDMKAIEGIAQKRKDFFAEKKIDKPQPYILLIGPTMNLDEEILKLTCALYDHYHFCRSDVTDILEKYQRFIRDVYNPYLLNKLKSSIFNLLDDRVKRDVEDIFKRYADPFLPVSSEDKRLRLYSKLGMYDPPKLYTIQPGGDGDLDVESTESVQLLSMGVEQSFSKIFQMEGLLEATIAHKEKMLASDSLLMSDNVQGSNCKRILANFKGDGIALPLTINFDGLEPGNGMGSHAGAHALDAIYATTCFPPEFASKLDSIVVLEVFHTKDRKKIGIEKFIARLIEELKRVGEVGFEVIVNGKKFKIHLLLTHITGDNLGLNCILGFVCSFHNTHCCRICLAGPEEIRTMTKENPTLLRTIDNYEQGLLQSSDQSGLTHYSSFNEVGDFHIIPNGCVDVMHDVQEGCGSRIMAKVLLFFIQEEKLFTIDFINKALKNFDFGFENSNRPPQINIAYVNEHKKLKMSASETLFFIRYFGVIVGHKIEAYYPEWELYLKLRDVVAVMFKPDISLSESTQMASDIEELLELWIDLGEVLTIKFHNLLHYLKKLRQNGPPTKNSAIRFESKHRELKKILLAIECNINVLQSLGVRLGLRLMRFQFQKYEGLIIKYGPASENSMRFFKTEPDSFKYVTVNDFTYKIGSIIVARMDENDIEFGRISRIYSCDAVLYFEYEAFDFIGFKRDYYAYSVIANETNIREIKYDSLVSRTPCLSFEIDGELYISTRYRL